MSNPVRKQSGFTLVELMISMLLGIIIIGGVISVLMSNRKAYRTGEGISQVQESARTAFELVARDVRQAGSTGCDRSLRTANVLTDRTTWYGEWTVVRGFDAAAADGATTIGTGVGQRVSATSSVRLHGVDGGVPVASHNAAAGTITLQNAAFTTGDILIICDFDHATVFRATNVAGTTITYATTGSPTNCSLGLGYVTSCASSTGNSYTFQQNAWVGRVQAVTWYIGNNGRVADGGTSLYRMRLQPGGSLLTEEVVAGVSNMTITYGRTNEDAVTAATSITAAQWDSATTPVSSLFIRLAIRSTDGLVTTTPGTDGGRVTKDFTYVVALRNRVQ